MASTVRERRPERRSPPKPAADRQRRQVDKMISDIQDRLRKLAALAAPSGGSSAGSVAAPAHIPELGRVQIVGEVDDAPEVVGRQGVALAGGPDSAGEWTHTVLVDTLSETYILPESALAFLGWTVPRESMYGGTTIRVRVDSSGHGVCVLKKAKQGT